MQEYLLVMLRIFIAYLLHCHFVIILPTDDTLDQGLETVALLNVQLLFL